MKAIQLSRYGPPEQVLQLEEVPKPVPGEREVVVRVQATAVNDYDWALSRGKPFLYRLLFGLTKPRNQFPGMELAGIVESVGQGVEVWKVGDAVYGDISSHAFGTFAEYCLVHENALVQKPESMTFPEAAAIPHAFCLAWQALMEMGGLRPGEDILINGGGGGVGTLGLQIAKAHDCKLTGVDSGDKLEMMQELGFDSVIDYRKVNFTRTGARYDLILDCKTGRSPFSYPRALKPGGRYVSIGGRLENILGILLFGGLVRLFSSKKLMMLGLKANKGLEQAEKLFGQGKLQCLLDGPYTLEDTPRLVQYFGEGKHKGKIVIEIHQNTSA